MVNKINLSKKTTFFPLKNRSLLSRVILFGTRNLPKKFPEHKQVLNVILLNDKQMTYYNETFLRHQGSTDVLAFSNLDDDGDLVGEIFVSIEMAWKSFEKYKVTFAEECILYIMHGILHLNGFDDHDSQDKKKNAF